MGHCPPTEALYLASSLTCPLIMPLTRGHKGSKSVPPRVTKTSRFSWSLNRVEELGIG